MPTAAQTHSIRPKAGNGPWEHVTDEQLASIKKQVGDYSFRSGYEVKAFTEKPEKLATTKPGHPDYLPEGTDKDAAK